VITKDTYRNHKNGELYEVLDIVVNATNGVDPIDQSMVLYCLVGNPFRKYVRDYTEFVAKFQREKKATLKQEPTPSEEEKQDNGGIQGG
jgi:hypothetical protein